MSLWMLFRVWVGIGVQSVGGGQAVMFLAQRRFVEERRWLTPAQWSEAYSLCQLVPGMVVVALVALTGRRLGGRLGVPVALLGLMLPSVAITILIAATVGQALKAPAIAAALHGVVLAVSGGSLVVLWKLAHPFLESSAKQGRWFLVAALAVLVFACVLLVLRVPVFAIMMAGGGSLALLGWRMPGGRSGRGTGPGNYEPGPEPERLDG